MNNFPQANFKRLKIDLSILFLVSLIIVLPIYFFGIPTGSDSPQHFQFALTFLDSVHNGNVYPSWAGATNGGFGDVGVRFYPPLIYYIMAGFRFLTGNWYDGSVLTFLSLFFVSGIGMYLWCREWFSENASLTAAVIYIFMPYHVNQLYNDTLFAEFAATSILPFCFLFITRICRTGKISDVAGLAFFYSLLILTHLPLTVIGSISLLIYSLLTLEKSRAAKTLLKLASAVGFGLVSSSFYWLRMITELNWVKVTTAEFSAGLYDFHANFIFSSLNVLIFGNSSRSSWNYDLMLLITLAMTVPSAILFYRLPKAKNGQKLFNVAALLVFSIFIASPLSIAVWENFSPLQKVQFPWRWLTIISLTSPIFIAAGFDVLINLFGTKQRPTALLAYGLIVAGMILTFTSVINVSFQMPRSDFNEQTKNLLNARSYEWAWTIWSKNSALANIDKISVENRSFEIVNWQRTEKEIVFSDGKPVNTRIALFYYPYWKASVNDEPTEIQPADDGTIIVSLPSKTALVKIWFEEPFYIKFAYCFSIFTWLIFGVFGLFKIIRRND